MKRLLIAAASAAMITAQPLFAFGPADLIGRWNATRSETSKGEEQTWTIGLQGNNTGGGTVRLTQTSIADVMVTFDFKKDGRFTSTTTQFITHVLAKSAGTWRIEDGTIRVVAEGSDGRGMKGRIAKTRKGFLFGFQDERKGGTTRVLIKAKRK